MSANPALQDIQPPEPPSEASSSLRGTIAQFIENNAPRVMSVSARGHELRLVPAPEGPEAGNPAEAISDELQSLMQSAVTLIDSLRHLHTQTQEEEAQAARTIIHLQDRLRLGAQMIKAFQTQIARIEQSVAELKALERRVEAAEERLMQRMKQVQAQIEIALEQFRERATEVLRQNPLQVAESKTEQSTSKPPERIAWK